MDFIKESEGKQVLLMMDSHNFYQLIDGKKVTTIPISDNFEVKTDKDLIELYKDDVEDAKATRDWLNSHVVDGLIEVMGL